MIKWTVKEQCDQGQPRRDGTMITTDTIIIDERVYQKYGMDRETFLKTWLEKSSNTLVEYLEMQFIHLSPDKLVMKMPVGPKTRQPYGLLHGGASVALAESAASYATMLNIDLNQQSAVGLEINANHIKSKKEGIVTAVATPLHRGKSTMVWDIKITDEENNLICISRCTVAVLNKRM